MKKITKKLKFYNKIKKGENYLNNMFINNLNLLRLYTTDITIVLCFNFIGNIY